jgi:hypothetical protein
VPCPEGEHNAAELRTALPLTVMRDRGVLEDVEGTADDLVDAVKDRITKH